jgi:hypothetical protein
MAVDGVARSIGKLEVLPQAERTGCRTRKISQFRLRGRFLIWKNRTSSKPQARRTSSGKIARGRG